MKDIRHHIFAIAGSVDASTTGVRLTDSNFTALAQRNRDVYNGEFPRNVGLVLAGCGGGGWWIAKFLTVALAVRELHLFDPKVLEPYHMLRMDVPRSMLGVNKAIALAAILRENQLLHTMRITAHPTAFSPDEVGLITNRTVRILDATDSYTTHVALSKQYSPLSAYLRVSYNGLDHATIADSTSSFCVGAPPTGYEVEQLASLTAVRVAAQAMPYIMRWLVGAPSNSSLPVKVRVSPKLKALYPKGVVQNG